jgi:hypothetical protein
MRSQDLPATQQKAAVVQVISNFFFSLAIMADARYVPLRPYKWGECGLGPDRHQADSFMWYRQFNTFA